MAKKKASAKKSNVKKVTKKVTKKVVKKTPSKKPTKKSVKTVSGKTKKTAKALPSKKTAKKTVSKSKAPAKKTAAKGTLKAPAKKSPAKTGSANKTEKLVDLSNFVTPLDDRLIVQTAGTEKMTAGGLYIPDTVADVSGNLQGFVVAVGRGHQNKKGHVLPMDVKIGDKIVFAEFSGTKVNMQNKDLIILREGDVLGVISK